MIDFDELDLPDLKYISRDESVAIEQNEFKLGTEEFDLMLNAGKSIANQVHSYEDVASVLIITGSGNNGGDGLVAAQHLSDKFETTVVRIKPSKTETAKMAFNQMDITKVKLYTYQDDIDLDSIKSLMKQSDILIDAVFGVGISTKVRGIYPDILQLYSEVQNELKIISVDVPSGLDATTGEWHGPEFMPEKIISFQHSKKGLERFDLKKIIVPDIGISKEAQYIVGNGQFQQFWPKRDPDSHKGQNGRIMVIGGSDEFTGAPVLSGLATLRTGVDTLRIAVPESIRGIVAGYNPDFIVLKVKGERHSTKGYNKYMDLTTDRHDVAAIGMGISNYPKSTDFVRDFFQQVKDKIKVVLDADAIRAYRGHLDEIRDSDAIITPHRAELRTILGKEIPKERRELVPFLINHAKELGITILLKGKIDIITNGDRILFNTTGHPGMTVGGTGDVLAGVVGAVNCFVEDRFYATAIATYLMGLAGEYAAEKYGNSLLATDIIEELPKIIMNELDK